MFSLNTGEMEQGINVLKLWKITQDQMEQSIMNLTAQKKIPFDFGSQMDL